MSGLHNAFAAGFPYLIKQRCSNNQQWFIFRSSSRAFFDFPFAETPSPMPRIHVSYQHVASLLWSPVVYMPSTSLGRQVKWFLLPTTCETSSSQEESGIFVCIAVALADSIWWGFIFLFIGSFSSGAWCVTGTHSVHILSNVDVTWDVPLRWQCMAAFPPSSLRTYVRTA